MVATLAYEYTGTTLSTRANKVQVIIDQNKPLNAPIRYSYKFQANSNVNVMSRVWGLLSERHKGLFSETATNEQIGSVRNKVSPLLWTDWFENFSN